MGRFAAGTLNANGIFFWRFDLNEIRLKFLFILKNVLSVFVVFFLIFANYVDLVLI